MNFGEAIHELKCGRRVSRKGWNRKGMWIEYQVPDVNSKMTRPYVYMNIPNGCTNQFGDSANPEIDRVPWLFSQTDIFADDWEDIA